MLILIKNIFCRKGTKIFRQTSSGSNINSMISFRLFCKIKTKQNIKPKEKPSSSNSLKHILDYSSIKCIKLKEREQLLYVERERELISSCWLDRINSKVVTIYVYGTPVNVCIITVTSYITFIGILCQ